MEHYNSMKVKLDDTELLSARIETTENLQGHTEYVIRVQRGPLEERSWRIRRRYNDFATLHAALQVSGYDLPLPPKKLFGNMDRDFISVRQQGLQIYINTVLSYPMLADTLHVKRFLDPVNYLENFQEKALQHIYMMFRCEPDWSMVEALPDIGWRLRRHYFVVRNVGDFKDEYIMSWCEYGPDMLLADKELASVMRMLTAVGHPFISGPKMVSTDQMGGMVIHQFSEEGTLRDYIYKAKPRTAYLKKYCHPKVCTPLRTDEIVIYGRQILEALKFLHEKAFPYGHLHTGNVLLLDGNCKLTGLENSFFGLAPYHRSFVTQLRKVKTLKELDVYGFGHIIYEMVFGESLSTPTCDNYPSTCSPQIKSVLESILTTEACKGGLPSVEHLLMHPLFAGARILTGDGKEYLRISSQLRDSMREVQSRIEARLSLDLKTFRQVQRLSRVQSILSLENKVQKMNRNLPSKKVSKEDSGDQRSASPASCTDNGSSNAPTPPPMPQIHLVDNRRSSRLTNHLKQKSRDLAHGLQTETTSPTEHSSGEKNAAQSPITPSANNVSSCSSGYESSVSNHHTTNNRSLLLESVQNFNRNRLRKAVTNDCSLPKF